MAISDEIITLVERKRRLSLTEADIAAMLFGQKKAYQQRVNSACRLLVARGLLVRRGRGGRDDPFTYHPRPVKRRKF
jgi:hypothetical protein